MAETPEGIPVDYTSIDKSSSYTPTQKNNQIKQTSTVDDQLLLSPVLVNQNHLPEEFWANPSMIELLPYSHHIPQVSGLQE